MISVGQLWGPAPIVLRVVEVSKQWIICAVVGGPLDGSKVEVRPKNLEKNWKPVLS